MTAVPNEQELSMLFGLDHRAEVNTDRNIHDITEEDVGKWFAGLRPIDTITEVATKRTVIFSRLTKHSNCHRNGKCNFFREFSKQ